MGRFRDQFMIAPPSETAMVLSGGGAYGAFGIGVMKALFAGRSPATGYSPLDAEIFVGTSVGAFNSAVMAEHNSLNCLEAAILLESIWLEQISERPGKCGNGVFRILGNPGELTDV